MVVHGVEQSTSLARNSATVPVLFGYKGSGTSPPVETMSGVSTSVPEPDDRRSHRVDSTR